MDRGFVHIYCGDGQGKTSAATGLALRFCSYGKKVLLCAFLKNTTSGEHCSNAGFDVLPCNFFEKMIYYMSAGEVEDVKLKTAEYFDKVKAAAPDYEMIVLDEILDAVDIGFITENDVLLFINRFKMNCEIVLTGRKPSEKIENASDYISEIKKVKHPYDKGAPARKSVEF